MPEGLSDEKTIQAIQENPYMQYLLGLPKFTEKPVFVPELFVQIRKRLDHEFFNLLTLLLSEADGSKPKKVHTDEDGNDHGGASIVNGYTYVDHLSWDAYNESSDLAMQLELYKKRFGMLPQEVQADKLYLGKANRNLIKTRRGPLARVTRWRPHSEPLKGFTGQTTSGRNLTTRLTHG